MTPERLQSLFTLLDDPDPEIYQVAETELLTYAKHNRIQLRQLQKDFPALAPKIKIVFQKIAIPQIWQDLADWHLTGGKDLLTPWLLLTKFEHPDIDTQQCKNQINRILNLIWLRQMPNMNIEQRLQQIHQLLFDIESFRFGLSDNKSTSGAYLLSDILDNKYTSSFPMMLLFYVICQELDIPVQFIKVKSTDETCETRDKEAIYYFLRFFGEGTSRKISEFYLVMADNKDVGDTVIYNEEDFLDLIQLDKTRFNNTNFCAMSNIQIFRELSILLARTYSEDNALLCRHNLFIHELFKDILVGFKK